MRTIKIGNKIISKDGFSQPYVIAEVGVNHEGSMEKAKMMIEEVHQSGGDAIKFQAYKADTLASKASPAYWDTTKEPTKSQHELFKKHDSFWKAEFEELADYAKHYKVDFLATPFDIESADFLEPLMPAYKIASADITNKPFLEYISMKGKPILLSTGASTVSEIWQAIEWIKSKGNNDIALLHCVLNYPTSYENANLGMIENMNKLFSDYVIGYSDHTLPDHMNEVMEVSWFLNAKIIEKHYTWNKKLPGNDHYHAMDHEDLKNFMDKAAFIEKIIGSREKNYLSTEEISRNFARRSLVARKPIPKGKQIDADDVTWKRPGTGIPPYMIEKVVGGTTLVDIEEDTILSYGMIKLNDNP